MEFVFFFFVIEKYFNLINRNIIFPRFDKFSNRCYLNFVQFKPRYIFFFFINSFIRVRIIRYSRIFVTFIQLIIYIYNIYEFILLSIFLDIPIFLNIPKMLKCGKKVRSRSVYFHAQFQVPLNDIVSFPIVSAWNYDRGLEKRLINELEDSRDSMKLHERCSRGGEGAASFSATCRLDHKLTITIKQ